MYRLLQAQFQGVAQIRAPGRTATAPTAAENIAEDVAENIAEAATAETTGPGAATGLAVDTGMAELVVGGPLLLVGEHFVGLFGLLELGHRFLVIRVAVRMVFHCQAAVGFFQILLAGVLGGPQHFVIISFGHNGSALFNVDFKLRRRALSPALLVRHRTPGVRRPHFFLSSSTSSNSASTTSSPDFCCSPAPASPPSACCASAYIF